MFTLPPLPYAKSALEPHITANTLSFHHEKHHQTYVTNLNNLIPNTEFADLSLEEIIVKSAGASGHPGIFNNAAQVWNHTFYWNCMQANGGNAPTGALADQITRDFGSFDTFRNDFKQAALTQFGSGWAWLVMTSDGKLAITKTGNADCPLVHGQTPLLTIDVWEHAYYLDFQNRRADYAETFLASLVNWNFVAENFEKASSQKAA
jgi:Fe-Mn family superoxide dismutase